MNKKILLFVSLVLMTIVSLGCASAAEDGESGTTTINIDNSMTNDQIQAKLDAELTDNSVINFAAGEYEGIKLKVTKDLEYQEEVTTEQNVTEEVDGVNVTTLKNVTSKVTKVNKTTVNNVQINGNGAILKGNPGMSNYYDGIFEVANVNGFTLSGFNFICQGVKMANMKTPSCVIVFNTTNGIIENNNISGGRFGLYLGSKFTNPNYDAIVRYNTVTDVSDMGIISFGSARSHIYNNTVINPKNHGIDVRHGSGPNCIVENNTIIGAREGIYLMHSAGHKAINNVLNFCDIGITCYGSSNIFCDENNFTNDTKIGFLLASGYTNIKIGENNDFSGLVFVPMPPTFTYNIVKANSDYMGLTSGTFSQAEATNTTYVQVYFTIGDEETQDPLEVKADTTTILTEEILKLNNNITVKIWKNDDNNHIDAGELINVTIDDVDYSGESDITGAVYVDITELKEGKHYMTVKYPGFNGLKESTWSGVLQIGEEAHVGEKLASEIVASDMNTTAIVPGVDKGVGEYFKVTLKDSEGTLLANKAVQIGFNGKIYDKETDENGVAQLQINLGYKGDYTFAICFLGDEKYNGSFAVCKIHVDPQKATLTVPNKSYAASAKTKTLTATFKSAKGNLIANKKVTFTVNGKTYQATTNDKGVATVKVSLNKKGTYNFTVKYGGDSTIYPISKNAKLVIK